MTSSVTAIVVSHNQGQYLRQALESILHQTKHVDRTIIINNGSIDNTEEIMREYISLYFPYVQGHTFEHNKGQLTAFNKGLSHSDSTYTCFVDADDELDHRYIAKLIHPLEVNKTAALSYSDTVLFGPREYSAWLTYPSEMRKKQGSSYTVHAPDYSEHIKYHLKRENYINNGALFVTKLAKDVGGFVEHDLYDLRHYLWYRLFDAGHTGVHVPHILYRYRQHSILQASWQWRVRKIVSDNPIDQQILYYQEEIEKLKSSPFYKTERVLQRLADNFKCDCEK